MIGQPDCVIDAIGEAFVAERLPREPCLEHVDSPTTVKSAITCVVFTELLVGLEDVVGLGRKDRRQLGGILDQQHGALLGDTHHLVQVPHQRVRAFDPVHQASLTRREQRRATPASVDMQPKLFRLADVCDRI